MQGDPEITGEKFGVCPDCGANTLARDVPMMHDSASGKVMPGHQSTDRQSYLQSRVSALSLQPGDLIIVRDERDMSCFVEMTQQGVGFSPYANPVLLIRGGLEKATRQDLLEALSVIDQQAAQVAGVTDNVSRIITDLNAPLLKKVQ
jgi:hypothetical protein